jgi:hypothetical protein
MNRRDFAKFFGVGTATAAVAAADFTKAVEAAAADEPVTGVDLAAGPDRTSVTVAEGSVSTVATTAERGIAAESGYCAICKGPCKAILPNSTIYRKADLEKSLSEPIAYSGTWATPAGFSYRTLPLTPTTTERTVMIVKCERPLTREGRDAMYASLKEWRDACGLAIPILILDPGLSVEFKTFTDASVAPAKASV